tara:strand:- start:915 stop:2792 length:1878 start_codon:yes stop_codon:yes gene_type:complete
MKEFINKDKKKKQDTILTTFKVPFDLGEFQKDFSISTYVKAKLTKEQIITQAFSFHSGGNITEAKKYYEYFINQGFIDHRVFGNYGNILKDLGRFKEAEIALRKAIKIKPDFAINYYNLALNLIDIGKLQEAEITLKKAINLKPGLAEFHSSLGMVLKGLGKLEDADISACKAIEINPKIASFHFNLGNILIDLGRLQEAEKSLRIAIEIKPEFALAYSDLGIVLKFLGKLNEAEISLRKAISLKPDYSKAYLNLGVVLNELGKREEASEFYLKVIEIDPCFPEPYTNLGLILLQKGEQKRAIKYFLESAYLLRAKETKECNDKRFRIISKAKIEHDIEQFEYLAKHGYEVEKFTNLALLYKEIASEINWPNSTERILLSNKHQNLIKSTYNRLIHRIETPELKNNVVNSFLNVETITKNYFDHEFGCTYIDNFLTAEAIEALREFLLGSTIWFDVKAGGYLGAYLKEGLANQLIFQIAEELRKKFPKIFKDYPINQIWAYKYDSRSKNDNSPLRGINVHADFAAVNVNFWITPSKANLNPYSGGLVVYDVEAPRDWGFQTYNSDQKKIREELNRSKGNTITIPHKENRAVVFNSDLFHETDNYEFKEGYENRRINVTMLFGDRE